MASQPHPGPRAVDYIKRHLAAQAVFHLRTSARHLYHPSSARQSLIRHSYTTASIPNPPPVPWPFGRVRPVGPSTASTTTTTSSTALATATTSTPPGLPPLPGPPHCPCNAYWCYQNKDNENIGATSPVESGGVSDRRSERHVVICAAHPECGWGNDAHGGSGECLCCCTNY